MSKGSRQRKSVQLTAESETARVQIWLAIPGQESPAQRDLRDEVMRESQRRDWTPVVRVARQCRVEGGPDQGRPYLLIEPRDAAELYAVLHRSRVLVLATAACHVRRNPSPNPSRHRDLVGLAGFVRYKASFGMLRDHGDISRVMERFVGWPSAHACDGLQDPRVLPLHVFDHSTEWAELDGREGVEFFAKTFGSGARRKDAGGRTWEQASAFHGRDSLTIAGYLLPHGFHWDVTRGDGGERIITTHEIWRLLNKYAYCNVYPDGYVRSEGKDARGVSRRIWPGS